MSRYAYVLSRRDVHLKSKLVAKYKPVKYGHLYDARSNTTHAIQLQCCEVSDDGVLNQDVSIYVYIISPGYTVYEKCWPGDKGGVTKKLAVKGTYEWDKQQFKNINVKPVIFINEYEAHEFCRSRRGTTYENLHKYMDEFNLKSSYTECPECNKTSSMVCERCQVHCCSCHKPTMGPRPYPSVLDLSKMTPEKRLVFSKQKYVNREYIVCGPNYPRLPFVHNFEVNFTSQIRTMGFDIETVTVNENYIKLPTNLMISINIMWKQAGRLIDSVYLSTKLPEKYTNY